MAEWINCSERLPEPNPGNVSVSQRVLICTCRRGISIARYWYQTAWWSGANTESPAADVTHWMPLPAPPEPRP